MCAHLCSFFFVVFVSSAFLVFLLFFLFFFFFKQKTAYEMRISDWSSDVCSSDLLATRKSRQTKDTLETIRFNQNQADSSRPAGRRRPALRAPAEPASSQIFMVRLRGALTGLRASIGSIGADDEFDIIIEHRRAATGETETGKLLYAGLDRSRGDDVELMQWEYGGRAQWFEASGVGKSSGMLQRPVPGRVTSAFGDRKSTRLNSSPLMRISYAVFCL